LPPTVALQIRTPHLGHLMRGVTEAIRHLRPVPDLGALVRLALSQVEPSLDVDGPVTLNLHREAAGTWHATALLPARPRVQAGQTPSAPALRWMLRRTRRFTVHVAHLSPTLAVLTDAPTFVEAHADELQADALQSGEPVGDEAASPSDGHVAIRARPGLWGPVPGPTPEPSTPAGPGAAASAWAATFEALYVGVHFGSTGVAVRARARTVSGSGGETGSAAASKAPSATGRPAPANALLIVAGDARRAGSGPLKAFAPAFAGLELLEAATPGPEAPGPGALESLAPVLEAIEGDFVWSLQSGPGAVGPTLYFDAALESLPPGLAALPVVYTLGGDPVRRLGGSGPYMPADLHHRDGRLRVAAGGAQRALLEGLVSGRLGTTPPGAASPTAVLQASVDLVALLRLFGAPVERPGAASPMTARLHADATGLEAALHVPFEQLDGLADLLERRAPDALPEGGSDWLFPDGI
jgi:hypothetical protein